MVKERGFISEVESVLNDAFGHPAGTERLRRLCEQFGGTRVYIPSTPGVCIAARNARIKKAARDGASYEELAVAHGLSVSHIRRIIHGAMMKR